MVPAIQNQEARYRGPLGRFEAFYRELIGIKMRILSMDRSSVEPPDSPEDVWRNVAAIIDRYSTTASADGPNEEFVRRETLGAMAAMADETFLNLQSDGKKWDGAAYWLTHLMEAHYFRTQGAGEVVFSKIQNVLASTDPADDELAVIYLTMLSLGFRGKYALLPKRTREIDELRFQLYEKVASRHSELRPDESRLFPEAYQSSVQGGAVRYLPRPGRWIVIAAGVMLFWLVVSASVWSGVSGPVTAKLDTIDQIAKQQSARDKASSGNAVPNGSTPLNPGRP